MTIESVDHPWLGFLRRHDEGQLLGHIEIATTIRPPSLNGDASAEVIITVGTLPEGPKLNAVLTSAAERIQAALTNLENIKAFAIAQAPGDWRRHYEAVDATPLKERLFLEDFKVTSPTQMEVAFDFGDLDMLVVRIDSDGHGLDVHFVA